MNFIFNELSFTDKFPTSKEPQKTVEQFIRLLLGLKKNSVLESVLCGVDLWNCSLNDNYNLIQWTNEADIDQRRVLNVILDKHFHRIFQENFDSSFEVDIKFSTYESLGCLVAANEELDVISMASSSCFEVEEFTGIVKQISSDGEEIQEKNCTLMNIFDEKQVESVLYRSKANLLNNIRSASDLWEHRKNLFPHLIFCQNVKKQLRECQEGGGNLKQILLRLKILEEYFSKYNGIYDLKELGHNARTESETVKSNRKLSDERLFALPDGSVKYFYDHFSFTGSMEGRIHFLPDPIEKRCYIGYIGKHLGTSNY